MFFRRNRSVKKILRKKSVQTGILLGGSAVLAKLFGLLRDRIFVQLFSENGDIDLIFSAFRIPDFFYYLLIGGTVSSIFIPRMGDLKKESEQIQYFSSFFWLVCLIFGSVCLFGVFFPEILVPLFAGGFEPEAQENIANLSQILFGSVFLLAVSSVFASLLQEKERFLSLAIAPVIYTATICGGTFLLAETHGIASVGISALLGALLYLLVNLLEARKHKAVLKIFWKKPVSAWKGFSQDFFRRLTNTAAFQINQSVDVLIASFLVAGSVASFTIGTNLGQVLLSVVAFPVANILFPKLTKQKGNHSLQKKPLFSGIFVILGMSLPVAIVGALFSQEILRLLYGLSGIQLEMAYIVFSWTIIALPATCLCPLLSRVFLANDDTKTPLWTTVSSLAVATGVAAYLSLFVFEGNEAIRGLAIGNFIASGLNAILLLAFFLKTATKSPNGAVTKNS